MKRKVYVKQMKMLKEKSKSNSTDKTETKSRSKEKLSSMSTPTTVISTASFSTPEVRDDSSPVPSASSTTSCSVPSTSVSNTTPLPKVDVLMKSSSIRTHHVRESDDSHVETSPQSSGYDNEKEYQGAAFKQEHVPGISYSGKEANQSDPGVNNWPTNPLLVGQRPGLSPVRVPSPYRVDYSGPYPVHVEVMDKPAEAPRSVQSPVFHQLQASQMNERSFNSDTQLQNPHRFGDLPQAHHDPYYIPANGPELSTDGQAHGRTRYGQDPSRHVHGDSQQSQYGQVRTWEQENYRYVDFTWRHDETADKQDFVYTDSTEESQLDQSLDLDTDVLDESIDLSNKTHRPTTRSSSGSCSRRRRKRVQTPVQRSAANMRERRRMCHLNVAFDYLKAHLPNVKDKKKLSRIQTLKAAIYYIHLLQDSLKVD